MLDKSRNATDSYYFPFWYSSIIQDGGSLILFWFNNKLDKSNSFIIKKGNE